MKKGTTSSRAPRKRRVSSRAAADPGIISDPLPPLPTPDPVAAAVYHVPHEHFMLALSFLIIALVGVNLSLLPAKAQTPLRPCADFPSTIQP